MPGIAQMEQQVIDGEVDRAIGNSIARGMPEGQ
jgi:hypothetical protein